MNNELDHSSEEFEYEEESDSLGYPLYYTHPEIFDLVELNNILINSDEVVGYNYNKNQKNPAMMADDNQYLYDLKTGELEGSAKGKIKLTNNKRAELINLLCDTTIYSGNWSGLAGVCYIPHVGFGFFKKDSLISQVSICFMCAGIRTNPFYKSDGLSETGTNKLNSFVKSIGLKVNY